MITLLANKFPIAQSLLSPSLPEVPSVVLAIALVLLITLAMALVVAIAGTLKSAVSYLAEAPANRLAMSFIHRHAASTSMYAQPTRPWVGRSSRKGSWFTLAAPVLPLNIQKLTVACTVNSSYAHHMARTVNPFYLQNMKSKISARLN
jgi:hypothetical protein